MYTKIDIISGFLGAGKTTLIKKFLAEKLDSEKLVIIENEFGEIGIDGGILKSPEIAIKELNSGCICCSLTGDFDLALKEVLRKYNPDRIIIEPSGVGKLSDILEICEKTVKKGTVEINMCVAVVDPIKYQMYIRNFSEFFQNQIKYAKTIILSRTQNLNQEKLTSVVKDIQSINSNANIITTPWEELITKTIVSVAEQDKKITLEYRIYNEKHTDEHHEGECHHHDVHEHEHSDAHQCHWHDKNDEHGCDHNDKYREVEHHHCCHNHSAEEVFQVWGVETPKIFSKDKIQSLLGEFSKNRFGIILRAKGVVRVKNDEWIQFDFVPEELEIKKIEADYIGRLCVIGEKLNKTDLAEFFSEL